MFCLLAFHCNRAKCTVHTGSYVNHPDDSDVNLPRELSVSSHKNKRDVECRHLCRILLDVFESRLLAIAFYQLRKDE